MNSDAKAPKIKITGTGVVKGPALKLLESSPDCPTARALNTFVSGMRATLCETAGGWTPGMALQRAAQLIDAEVRLGSGGDVEGVAAQVGGLMLIAIEKSILNPGG